MFIREDETSPPEPERDQIMENTLKALVKKHLDAAFTKSLGSREGRSQLAGIMCRKAALGFTAEIELRQYALDWKAPA